MTEKNNYYNNFVKKRNENEPFELEAIKIICEKNKTELKVRCDTKEYDFITKDNISYEIKADHASKIYGNIFIEFQNINGKSGILTTKADKHIITDGTDNYYMIETLKLKKYIKETKPPIREVKNDMLMTKGFIINFENFKKIAIKIK